MLIQISNADGQVNVIEEEYINRIAGKLGISFTEIAEIRNRPEAYIVKLPETYSQRLELFYYLLFFMGIDDAISFEEKELCKKIGFKLCFNPLLMDDLINIMVENIGQNVPVDQVIKTILKYQN